MSQQQLLWMGVAAAVTGQLWVWGSGNSGQLGLGNTTNYSSPKQVGTGITWAKLQNTVGNQFSVAVKTDGTLWAWGKNTTGQLGLGNTTDYSSPKQVGALTNWSVVACGSYNLTVQGFTVAVKTDGTLWAWGSNLTGQLGIGNTTDFSSPKQVGALTNWSTISAGSRAVVVVKTDGTLWVFGQGSYYGALGLGNTTNYSSPKQVGALTNWSLVHMGRYIATAVKTDGTLWTWGKGTSGALGLGNTTNFSSPKQVGALTNWSVAKGSGPADSNVNFVIARKTDGTLWAWGTGTLGVLGLGNTTDYSSPKQVGALTNWSTKIAVGGATAPRAAALKTDGALWTWGAGTYGQLGLGTTTNYSSPKQVGSSLWAEVGATNSSTRAISL